METPLSTRRITRSQTSAMSRKVEESDKCLAQPMQMSGKKQQQDRSVLTDITNDSPIVGVAMGNLETPSSSMSKKRPSGQPRCIVTPGSGEALLRGQVKTLLQKVEEEAEFPKLTIENRPFLNHLHQGLVKSPCISLAAPTPANTPQVLNFSNGLPSVAISSQVFLIPQMIREISYGKKQEGVESDNVITRSLLLDFSEKSESSDSSKCSSGLTCHAQIYDETESSIKKPSTDDDDDSSIWSIQANASSTRDDEEGDNLEGDYLDEDEEEEEEEYDYGDIDDDICEGISKISFHGTAEFTGKHIRFMYNSDDEEYTEC